MNSSLKMEEVRYSEKLVHLYQITWRHTPADSIFDDEYNPQFRILVP
jgi:hypothetical protein